MDNDKSRASSPSRNPFSDSDLVCAGLDSDEQFVGDELKAFFDKEEKLYQSTSSVKSDYGEKSQVMTSGITMRSFMVDSGDSDLIQQKLTMSQYIAYRSEPLGQLGDSSFQERPYFSFQESNSSGSEKSDAGVAEFNPDFSTEPSWMQKKSLSSLSSSENLEIPSKSPDCSENWLIGNNNNHQSAKEKMSLSDMIVRESQGKCKLVECSPRIGIASESQPRKSLCEDNKTSLSLSPELEALEIKNQSGFANSSGSDCGSSLHPENSVDESAAYKADEEEEDSPNIPTAVHQEPGEVSELPSFYFKPHENESRLDLGQSEFEQGSEKLPNGCHSYVTGHVETLSFGSNCLIGGSRHSDVAASTQTSSASPASTVRENVDFQRYDSLCVSVSEPQLSSTREITDDCIDLGLSLKRVHFMQPGQEALRNPRPMQDTMLDATPNLCSTARSCAVATPAQERTPVSTRMTQISKSEERNEELIHDLVHESKLSEEELERLSRDLTQAQDGAGFTPESWIAVFANTSSLSTPLLMNKLKEHVIRQHSRGASSAHVPATNSSASEVLGGMDDLSSRNFSSLLKPPPSNRVSTQAIPSNGTCPSSSPVAENRKNAQPAFPGLILDSDSLGKSPNGRHTLASLPIPSVQVVSTGRVTPVNDPVIQNEGLTSTVKKKLPSPEASNLLPVVSQDKASLTEKRKAIPSAPIVKCNKSHVYFGGCKVRQSQSQSLVVLNSSFKEGLRLELRIKDSQDFHIMGAERTLTSRLEIQLEPRQERTIDLVFRPNSIGPSVTKLNLYPRCETVRNLKYTVDLSGYGGSSKIHVGPDQILIPKRNATFWTCKIYLENHGNVDGFVCVQPFHDDGTPIDPFQCVILPQCFLVNAGSVKEVDVFIHPLKDKNATPFNLRLFWGDEPLRIRWMKCITKGAPLKCVTETEGIDWTKLLHLGCAESTDKCDFGDEDMDLFYANIKTEKLTVIYQGVNTDSQFVTLAMETVTDTVLEPYSIVSGAMPSQRRVTTAICGKPSPSATLSTDVTELQFPPTRVGLTSSQKISLENKGSIDQEIHVKQITGPFSMVHTRSVVRSGFYARLAIQFNPVKSGSFSGSVVLAVDHSPQLLVVALKGDAL